MSNPRVYLCTGNEDAKYVNIVIENLLVELKTSGKTPLLISIGKPPFSTGPLKTQQKESGLKYFDYYTGAKIPTIELSDLAQHLSDTKRRDFFISEESKLDEIYLYGASPRIDNMRIMADELILFIKRDASSSSWVYNVVKQLMDKNKDAGIDIVTTGVNHLEEAAIFFSNLREEIASLLGRSVKMAFSGFIKFNIDHLNAALSSGKTIIELFNGGQFHGMIRYILRNLPRNVDIVHEESFLSRWGSDIDKNPV